MPEHIFLSWKPESISYRAFGKPVSEVFPARERRTHAEFLQRKLHDIWKEVEKNDSARAAVSLPTRNGTYIEFIGSPDELLNIQSLENKPSGIKLLNSRMVEMDNQKVIKATVYIPKGKENFFLKRIENYGEESPKGKPKHQKLVATINDIRGAVLESFWIGEKEWMPGEESLWCEIWIRDDVKDLDASKIVRQVIQELGIQMKKEEIDFQERKVILIKANKRQLMEVIARSEFIAEIKRAVEVNSFFLDIENIEQVKWAKELLERSKLEESNVAVSILDTGINNGNLLLATVAADEDIHSYFTDVGNDIAGHGTKMAGIAAYGDLKEALTSQEEIILSHPLESVKILPDGQTNDPELFGAITAQSASTLYINKPERERIICMAVTAQEYSYLDGRPSSWSAALDNLIHGTMDEIQKVFIVSTGNIRGPMNVNNYPASCLIEAVEDPGQSWNAITVGAYTRLDVPEDKKYKIVAKSGELSPYSRSSITFDKIWPIKPEIVLEGGNAVKSGDGAFEDAELSVLTTSHNPIQGIFTTVNATSAATASASWLAAKIQTTFPQAWPETVRALLIHSAEWTSEMKKQFLEGTKKSAYRPLLRTCGYGVPSFERAVDTVNNRVNLIIQSELQPFDKVDGKCKTNEMHIHELPWPKEELLTMLDAEIEMKVTLSYFIEPGPGEKGWKDKYRYASCGLRFDLNGTSDKESFIKRINKASLAEDEKGGGSSSIGWTLGPDNRNVGSIHSDTWIGTAATLATSNYIGIYPVIGWWRERGHLKRWDHKIRYSLVVSLSTAKVDVDLLTPIQNKIAAKIAAEVETVIEIK